MSAAADVLSVLHSRNTCPMAKTWQADGTVIAYSKAKHFRLEKVKVEGIHDLSALLTRLEGCPNACIIRGEYVGEKLAMERTSDAECKQGEVLRRDGIFKDQYLHTLLIEVDEFEPLRGDPALEPLTCIVEYITAHLPESFSGASCHWQLSNSAGHPTKEGKLKVHLWFWLATPRTSAELRGWAKSVRLQADQSVFHHTQVHYTSAPIFEQSVTDPVPERSGFFQGLIQDEVELEIMSAVLPAAGMNTREAVDLSKNAGECDDMAGWLHEHWEVLGESADKTVLYIRCPWEGEHTTDTGPSSTVYFLAGTGGYARGHFNCKHSHCSERRDKDFLAAIGYEMPFEGDINRLFSDVVLKDEHVKKMANAEFLIPNMIVRGHVAAYVAPGNGGKTTIFVYLCEKLSAMGMRVLYINLDGSPGDLKRHYAHAKKHGYDVIAPDACDGKSATDVIMKFQTIAQGNQSCSEYVFILDTLKKFVDVINKSQAKDLYKLLRTLTVKGATVCLLGHCNKYKDEDGKLIFEGTADLRNDLDELIYLDSCKNEVTNQLEVTTRPDKVRAEFSPTSYVIDLNDDRKVSEPGVVFKILSKEERGLVDLISEAINAGQHSQKEIIEWVKGKTTIGDKKIRDRLLFHSTDESSLFEVKSTGRGKDLHYTIRPQF